MAELAYYSGTMDCGKSTLALQLDHNHRARGRVGRVFTSHDRAGEATLSSRLGLEVAALEVGPQLDFWEHVVESLTRGERLDYLICDEVQFYSARQIDDLARIVDDLAIDVFAFGILTDFRTRLFEGSARMIELADRVHTLQVEALCWCGVRATHNARTENGVMVIEGEVIVVGDVADAGSPSAAADPEQERSEVGYEVLCRRHHRQRLTAAAARAVALSPETLPFGREEQSHSERPID